MGGVLKLAALLVIGTAVFLAAVLVLPVAEDFSPLAYEPNLPETLDGPFTIRNELDNFEKLFENELIWPESLAMSPKGELYTGTADGTIRRVSSDRTVVSVVGRLGRECAGQWEERLCGRPLGLRFHPDTGQLHVVDAYYGYHVMDPERGTFKPVLESSEAVEGDPLVMLNDLVLDVARNKVYLTQSSTKYPLSHVLWSLMEHETSGRVLEYDVKTKKVKVLAKNLHFPNGIQLSKDGSFLLVAETGMNRILKLELKAGGSQSVLIDKLPGEPDNIRPASTPGHYWVAVMGPRSRASPTLGDLAAPFPVVRKVVVKLAALTGRGLRALHGFHSCPDLGYVAGEMETGRLMAELAPRGAMVLKIDETGKVVKALSSSSKLSRISEVLEHDGHLFIGSWRNPYIAKVAL